MNILEVFFVRNNNNEIKIFLNMAIYRKCIQQQHNSYLWNELEIIKTTEKS